MSSNNFLSWPGRINTDMLNTVDEVCFHSIPRQSYAPCSDKNHSLQRYPSAYISAYIFLLNKYQILINYIILECMVTADIKIEFFICQNDVPSSLNVGELNARFPQNDVMT